MEEKRMEVTKAGKASQERAKFGKSLGHSRLFEKSSLYLDASDSLLWKIDIFMSNTNLTVERKKEMIKLLEESFSEGYTLSMIS